ncbi:uncharacterized protein LOC141864198 [Acropora palmata]|uniref:uncharacterized protein LOC141864198 n=1 Tax=Acropora palmata TaxID=6131 RepID=UPI003DA044CC
MPFLRRFVSLAVKQGSKETFVSSDEIFEDYCQAVALWTDGDSLHGQTKYLIKKAAFYKQLKKELEQFANSNNWDVRSAVKSGRIRGYSGIQLQRPRRRPALEFGGRVMLQRLQHYMRENPKPDPPIELHEVPSDPRGAGICAFASRDIQKCEIICEFEGEHISLDEAERREALYSEQGRPCTLMVIESGAMQIA